MFQRNGEHSTPAHARLGAEKQHAANHHRSKTASLSYRPSLERPLKAGLSREFGPSGSSSEKPAHRSASLPNAPPAPCRTVLKRSTVTRNIIIHFGETEPKDLAVSACCARKWLSRLDDGRKQLGRGVPPLFPSPALRSTCERRAAGLPGPSLPHSLQPAPGACEERVLKEPLGSWVPRVGCPP
ncbi:hypothetical protein AAFF_G00406170 [Aldrovandia affinis]|uniref:Uncharacterized protein n=1 Tax=Aldrovandia affinis TaxID=143900 RepID=A0AAD7SC53_9TELE|nr:hypothetical protein AAFF_G00406170 [Aldrovandia affinis]